MTDLTHLDSTGAARMVDVSGKDATDRTARATGMILMSPEALAALRAGTLRKGDALAVARVAGIMAAKRTAELIPLCHPVGLTAVEVDLTLESEPPGVSATAAVRTVGRTGVEMEALTAVLVALATVYDMAKSVDRQMVITDVRVLEKKGGRSG